MAATVPMRRPPGSAPRMAPEEALARGAEHDRPPELPQPREPAQQRQVVSDGLAEADAGVDQDLLLGDAVLRREHHALLEEGADVVDDVVVVRLPLHRLRFALHVHEDHRTAGVGDDVDHLRIHPESAHVVDDRDAGRESPPRDFGLVRVDGQHSRGLGPQPLDDREDARQFVFELDSVGAGARGLAADVDDRGAVARHGGALRDRRLELREAASVRE